MPRPSPLPNRVDPAGDLIAHPARGLFMGNRGGRFHTIATQTPGARRWASRQWICCRLAFRGRRRAVWGRGYTELFFCDEVTALAAGHRPCFECRRADARAFAAAVARGLGLPAPPTAADLDRMLDAERRDGRAKRTHRRTVEGLPDGAMIDEGGRFLALRDGRAVPWTAEGYGPPRPVPAGSCAVLTPPTTLAALTAGYAPVWG